MVYRKWICVLLALLLCLAAAGCARGDRPPVELTVVPESVTPTGLTYRVRQTAATSWEFGYDYTLEKREGDGWTAVPYAETAGEYAFNAVGLLTPENGDAKEFGADWSMLYGELVPGRYRIGKSFDPPHGSGLERITLYAEFEITE